MSVSHGKWNHSKQKTWWEKSTKNWTLTKRTIIHHEIMVMNHVLTKFSRGFWVCLVQRHSLFPHLLQHMSKKITSLWSIGWEQANLLLTLNLHSRAHKHVCVHNFLSHMINKNSQTPIKRPPSGNWEVAMHLIGVGHLMEVHQNISAKLSWNVSVLNYKHARRLVITVAHDMDYISLFSLFTCCENTTSCDCKCDMQVVGSEATSCG